MPDYDGRPDPGLSTADALLLVPRAVLLPVYVVLEYGVRQPLLFVATTVEREGWLEALRDALTWDAGRATLLPTFFWDLGFRPSVGARLTWRDLGAPGHDLRAAAATWGPDWLLGRVVDSLRVAPRARVELSAEGLRRPDRIFAGIGYDSLEANRSRFAQDELHVALALQIDPWRASRVRVSAGVDWLDFANSTYRFDQDMPIADAVAQGVFELPPGFEGYAAYRQRLEVVVDSRVPEVTAGGDGARARLFAEQAFELLRPTESSWVRYGGSLAGFADLGARRVLGIWGFAGFADPLGSAPVPFTELVEPAGDPLPLGGFRPGRLRGRSGVAATLEYRYSVLPWVDGQLFVSLGNVFGEHLSDFAPDRLRVSFGAGLRTVGTPDGLALVLAFGSETFEQGAELSSVRLAVGTHPDF